MVVQQDRFFMSARLSLTFVDGSNPRLSGSACVAYRAGRAQRKSACSHLVDYCWLSSSI